MLRSDPLAFRIGGVAPSPRTQSLGGRPRDRRSRQKLDPRLGFGMEGKTEHALFHPVEGHLVLDGEKGLFGEGAVRADDADSPPTLTTQIVPHLEARRQGWWPRPVATDCRDAETNGGRDVDVLLSPSPEASAVAEAWRRSRKSVPPPVCSWWGRGHWPTPGSRIPAKKRPAIPAHSKPTRRSTCWVCCIGLGG